jgi:hypothetical protein
MAKSKFSWARGALVNKGRRGKGAAMNILSSLVSLKVKYTQAHHEKLWQGRTYPE